MWDHGYLQGIGNSKKHGLKKNLEIGKTNQAASIQWLPVIGNRSKEHLAHVINQLLTLSPKRIYTDKLVQYNSLIPVTIHNNAWFRTNGIERFNVNIRIHIKCLSRKTICFSESIIMLEAITRIYFWGHTLEPKFLMLWFLVLEKVNYAKSAGLIIGFFAVLGIRIPFSNFKVHFK